MLKKVYFKNSKGDSLCGIINNPSGDTANPVIIIATGLRASKDRDTYTVLAERLAIKNLSTFRFDFYGHGESEGRFEDITISEAVDDTLQAINYLKAKGYNKIGLIGQSFGGLSSIMTASRNEDLYLLVLISPVSNYPEKERETKPKEELDEWKARGYKIHISRDGSKHKLNYSFFEDFKNNDGYKAAPKINVPTLIVHGDKDKTVPYKQSVRTCELIPNCKLHTIKGADHRYENPEHKEEMWRMVVDFVVENSLRWSKCSSPAPK